MDGLHLAIKGFVATWQYRRPPLWPSTERQLKLPWSKTTRDRVGSLVNAILAVFIVGLFAATVYFTATANFGHPRDYVIFTFEVLVKSLFPFLFPMAFFVLFTGIIVVENAEAKFPSLRWSIPDLWRKEDKPRINAVLIPARHRVFGLTFTAILVLLAPTFATYEEIFFREQQVNTDWPIIGSLLGSMHPAVYVIVWSVLVFGLIHVLIGVSIGEALMLGAIGGLYFAGMYYFLGGLHIAILAHTGYNILAIGFMVSTDARTAVSKLLYTAAERVVKSG